MTRTKSKNWYLIRKKEFFHKLAKENKLISRAWFKISDINKKYNILKKNFKILEAGCNPGGWTKYIKSKIGKGKLICFDKIQMRPMSNIFFFQGDLNDVKNIEKNIINILISDKFDVIVSDISAPLSGIRLIDINCHIKLLYNLVYICNLFLVKNGSFVAKFWNGDEFKTFLSDIKKKFNKIYICKPQSSLSSSTELYIIAKQYRQKTD